MLQAPVKELKAMPELLQSTHPSLQNQFSWSWTSHVFRNILKRMLEWWSPVLSVANADTWHGWSSRTKSVAGMVLGYDPAFLGACPATSSRWRWHIHPSTPRETGMETLGAQGKRVREQITISWSGQRDGGSLSPLEKANTTLGSRRWQTNLQTRSHTGVRRKQNA